MAEFRFEDEIILESDRVKLRPLRVDDFDLLLEVATDDSDLMKYSRSPVNSEENLRFYIRDALSSKSKGARYPFIIYDKKQSAYGGSTSFGSVSNDDLRLEIGWSWLGKRFQGTGLNKATKFLLLKYAFDTLKFERVEFKADARNMQSRRALEGIGASYEGLHRHHSVMSDGFRRDAVYYSIIRPEWPDIRSRIFSNEL